MPSPLFLIWLIGTMTVMVLLESGRARDALEMSVTERAEQSGLRAPNRRQMKLLVIAAKVQCAVLWPALVILLLGDRKGR